MTYLVVVCNKCGRLMLAKVSQKTRQCPHCENRIHTEKAKVIASAKTAQEALKLIQALKLKQETTH